MKSLFRLIALLLMLEAKNGKTSSLKVEFGRFKFTGEGTLGVLLVPTVVFAMTLLLVAAYGCFWGLPAFSDFMHGVWNEWTALSSMNDG